MRAAFDDELPTPEADDGQLASSNEFLGEGPGDPKQLAGLGHGVDEALFSRLAASIWGDH
jgi:hypothetical protein